MKHRIFNSRVGKQGYTAVEVLVAMTLFAIGASGVVAMQRMAVTANAEARRVDVANGIARAWIERLRRDATMWTLPSIANPTASSNLGNAKLLSLAIANDGAYGTWAFPDQAAGAYQPANRAGFSIPVDGLSPMFDTLGRDLVGSEASSAYYCVEIRADWIVPQEFMRAQVRVWWPRTYAAATPSAGAAGCNNNARNDANGANGTKIYNFVYAVTAIRKNSQT
jgi:type IV pilus assembly protein PilV